jgi:hypothetical protein
MSEKEKRGGADYFASLTVEGLFDIEVLDSEKVWDILDYVHRVQTKVALCRNWLQA